ncbi:hypothetical protein MTP99_006396 [Tenebrio molitor]|uniref:coiled-coil domain-containing protein 42 like-2-like n=1 Tax=Tenebrio molitor TaxID=7067 RepID=UPI002705AD74|nr:hypothetical protein MTP99_006396 [Tenebrio molitor]
MVKFAGLKIHPEKFVRDYLISKNCTKLRKNLWELLTGPEITLERLRAEFIQTEDLLKKKRLQCIEKRKELDQKWEDIAFEGQSLKDNFITFNQFMVVNVEKRKRANEIIDDNKKLVEQRQADIENLEVKLVGLKQSKENFDRQIHAYAMYQNYLNEVLVVGAVEEGFKNEQDIIDRFEYYTELSRDLADKQAHTFDVLQQAKTELDKYREVNGNVVMGLQTQLIALQGRFEDASRRARHMEVLVYRIKEKARQQYSNIRATKSSIWNLYVLMRRRKRRGPQLAKDDVEEQLIYISKTLRQCRALNNELNKKHRRSSIKRLKK